MTTKPTREFVKNTLSMSHEYLNDRIVLLERERVRSCIDRAYYSIHQAAIALLSDRGIRPPKSHRGLVSVFGREIVNRGLMGAVFARILSDSLEKRMDSTYSANAQLTLGDAERSVQNAKRFLATVGSILNL